MSNVVLCGRRTSCATFSEDALHFSWQAQHFGDPHVILRGRGSTFDVSCCVSFANRTVRAARHGDTHHSTLYTLYSTLDTPHFPLDPTSSIPHFTLDTLHPTLYTPQFTLTLQTFHPTLDTPHLTLQTFHFTLHT